MPSHQTLSALAFFSLTVLSVGQSLDPRFGGQTCPAGYARTIDWIDCGGKGETEETQNADNLECGTLDVPLDYQYPGDTSQTLRIPLIRIPRKADVTGPRKSIVYNPGGPGGGGIEALARSSMPHVWEVSEGQYDIVTFDPRGVALSNPFLNNGANTNYKCRNEISARSYETTTDLEGAVQDAKDQGEACKEIPVGTWGQLVGSAFVARDIIAISDVVNEDKLVRYFGASYGTLLGATLAQMFPLQMDRVVLDGNINPIDYYYGLGDESVADADRALTNFFTNCVENTNTRCFLTDGSYGVQDLQTKWDQYLGVLYAKPDENVGTPQQTLRYEKWREAKQGMNNQLFNGPGELAWSKYSKTLASSMRANGITVNGPPTKKMKRAQVNAAAISYESSKDASANNGRVLQAVTCGDYINPDNLKPTLQTFTDTLTAWKARSKYMYDNYITTQFTCYGWQTPAKEQFAYPRSGRTKTAKPVLFVQTLYDPVTPEVSADNSANTFLNAGVIKSSGAGHCSNSQSSNDLDDKIKSYWRTGDIPVQTAVDKPTTKNAFDVDAPRDSQTDAAEPPPGLEDTEGGAGAGTRKRDAWVFPRHLLEKPFETQQFGRRQDGLVPVGCKPLAATTTTSSLSSTTAVTSTSTSTTSTGTTTTTTTSTTTSSGSTTTTSTGTTTTTTSTTTGSESTTTSHSVTSTTSGSTTSSGSQSTTSTTSSVSNPTTSVSTTSSTSTGSGSTTTTVSTGTTSSTTSSSTTTTPTSLTSTTSATSTGPTSSTTLTSTTGSTTSTESYSTSTSSISSVVTSSTASTSTRSSVGYTTTSTPYGYTTTSGLSFSTPTRTFTFSDDRTTTFSKTWTTQTRTITYTATASLTTTSDWNDWKSTTTSKPDPIPAWGAWNTASEYKTFTKTFTTLLTISKCPAHAVGCNEVVSTKTIVSTTVYPTITVYQTDITEICSTGLISKPVTITATCNSGCTARPTGVPDGYTATKAWCGACAKPGFVDIITSVYVYKSSVQVNNIGNRPADPTAVTWNNWNVGSDGATTKTPAIATPTTWNDWSSKTDGVITKTPVAATATVSAWNDWNSNAGVTSTSKTLAPTTGLKTYTGDATKQIINGGTLVAGLIVLLLL